MYFILTAQLIVFWLPETQVCVEEEFSLPCPYHFSHAISLTNTPKMSSRRFSPEEAPSHILNLDSDAEEEISETEDNVIDDPDFQFSDNEEDSEDEPAIGSPSDESQRRRKSSSTEGTWAWAVKIPFTHLQHHTHPWFFSDARPGSIPVYTCIFHA